VLRLEAANRMRNYHLMRLDKLGMAAALEIRSPFLDARVTGLANRLPGERKRAGGRPKGMLIDAYADALPGWLVQRRKQPFTMPVATWLAGALRDYARHTLGDPNAWVRAFVAPGRYLDAFDAQPTPALASRLWSLLQLEAWHSVWKEQLA